MSFAVSTVITPGADVHRIQIEPEMMVAQGAVLRKARIDVDEALGLAHVVDICGRALHMESEALSCASVLPTVRVFDLRGATAITPPPFCWPTTRVAEAPATSISALRNRPLRHLHAIGCRSAHIRDGLEVTRQRRDGRFP
jgi:hypothetical protein